MELFIIFVMKLSFGLPYMEGVYQWSEGSWNTRGECEKYLLTTLNKTEKAEYVWAVYQLPSEEILVLRNYKDPYDESSFNYQKSCLGITK